VIFITGLLYNYARKTETRWMLLCCIRRGPGGERIVDVVPEGTELEPLVKSGSWTGCSHS